MFLCVKICLFCTNFVLLELFILKEVKFCKQLNWEEYEKSNCIFVVIIDVNGCECG